MAAFKCPTCGADTVYRMYSGGNEYICEGPEAHEGIYPATGKNLPRATMLRTPEGTAQLRAEMQAELARRNASFPEFCITCQRTHPHGWHAG